VVVVLLAVDGVVGGIVLVGVVGVVGGGTYRSRGHCRTKVSRRNNVSWELSSSISMCNRYCAADHGERRREEVSECVCVSIMERVSECDERVR
jgi:hypothetical protein